MSTVVAPTMIWYHLLRKLSLRSSVTTVLSLLCISVILLYILFTATMFFQKNNSTGYFTFHRFRINHSGFIFSNLLAKRKGNSNLEAQQHALLFIAVVSSVRNSELRKAIRATWGHPLTQLSENVVIRYFTGISHQRPQNVSSHVSSHESRFDDEIQLHIADSYFKLASKSKLVLDWISSGKAPASDFVMKVDDDTFVNLPLLANYLRNVKADTNIANKGPMFFCYLHVNATPKRENISDWFVETSMFNGTNYPKYCSGSAYAFSSSLAKPLTDAVGSLLSQPQEGDREVPEDVLVTGLAPLKLNVIHVNMRPHFECCFYPKAQVNSTGKVSSSRSLAEWLCRRATEGAMVLHPLKMVESKASPGNLMGALLVASLIGSFHECLNLASSSSVYSAEDDGFGNILTVREAVIESNG